MPTLDRAPTNEEVAEHARTHPIPFREVGADGALTPRVGGVWYLVDDQGEEVFSILTPAETSRVDRWVYSDLFEAFERTPMVGIVQAQTVGAYANQPV